MGHLSIINPIIRNWYLSFCSRNFSIGDEMFTNLETYQSRFWLKEEFLKDEGKVQVGFCLNFFLE